MKSPIRLEMDAKVAVLTIDRNERRNSLDNDAIDAFLAALGQRMKEAVTFRDVRYLGTRLADPLAPDCRPDTALHMDGHSCQFVADVSVFRPQISVAISHVVDLGIP